jgi:hypothetical protein
VPRISALAILQLVQPIFSHKVNPLFSLTQKKIDLENHECKQKIFLFEK